MATMAGSEMERMQAKPSVRRAMSMAERNHELFDKQRARRRGPTPEMFFTKHIDNSRIRKEDDPVRRREMLSFTFAMLTLCALTMVYVWQHFSAIDVGYKVETQKQQVEQLREDNRRLRLTEAELSDPNRIDHIARQLGMEEPMPGQIVREDGVASGAPVLAQVQVQTLTAN